MKNQAYRNMNWYKHKGKSHGNVLIYNSLITLNEARKENKLIFKRNQVWWFKHN